MTAPNNISESPSPDSASPEKNGEIPDVDTPEPAKLAKTKSTPRKKIGRPKGQPKTGGRKKPGPEPSGREARKYLEQNSGYLDLLCRMLRGKPIKRQGPTGKLVWYHPDFDDQKWALAQILPRMIPTLASQEIGGIPDGEPVGLNATNGHLPMLELARQAAFLLDLAGREADEARSPDSAPRGATALAADASRLSTSAAAPAPTTTEAEDTPAAASQPDREPVPGEVADVAGYAVHCKANSREGLPVIFEIRDDHGRQIRYPVNGFANAIEKIRELAGEGADMTVKISAPRPAFSQSRPNERAARSTWQPEIHGSYSNRKR